MSYRELIPHSALASLIDAYWVSQSAVASTITTRIMPDGCIDIIFNLGADRKDEGRTIMKHEQTYLVGTMTTYIDAIQQPDTYMAGVRFKPGAFTAFYNFAPLHEITNTTIELKELPLPEINPAVVDLKTCFDTFFLKRLQISRNVLPSILAGINKQNGLLTVEAIAKQYAVSSRQLERTFKQHIGISPKAYINFVRYQSAFKLIKQGGANRSLADIAFDCGYYDQSHLTNEIKKYTGLTPLQL
jgi:AraC-like DNA-binding protein